LSGQSSKANAEAVWEPGVVFPKFLYAEEKQVPPLPLHYAQSPVGMTRERNFRNTTLAAETGKVRWSMREKLRFKTER
jgi:hypothetical protein